MSEKRIVENYIERVLKLQASRQDVLAAGELSAIASELGASVDHLDAGQREDMRRIETGLTKLHSRRFDLAVGDLEEATALCPASIETLNGLAAALWTRHSQSSGRSAEADKARAKMLCDRGLHIDPAHVPMRALLHAMSQGQPQARSAWRGAAVALLCTSVGVGGGWAMALQTRSQPQPLPAAQPRQR